MSSNLYYVFDGSYYAFTASGGFIMETSFPDLSYNMDGMFERFDVTDAVQVLFDVSIFNEKLGLIKDASNDEVLDSSFNFELYGGFPNDSITIDANEFTSNMAENQVISLGRYTTLYSEFSEYVRTYFGYYGGFASLFKGSSSFTINNDALLDPSGFIQLITAYENPDTGEFVTDLSGEIEISNINNLLRAAVIRNTFGNRHKNNEGNLPTDGFMSGDLIFVPNGTDVTIKLNIASEAFLPMNNFGDQNLPELTQNNSYSSPDQLYGADYFASLSQLKRVSRAPLLIRLANLPDEVVSDYTPYIPHSYGSDDTNNVIVIQASSANPNSTNVYVGTGSMSQPFYSFYTAANETTSWDGIIDVSNTYTFHRVTGSGNFHPFYISDVGYEQVSTSNISLTGDGSANSGIVEGQSFTLSFDSSVNNLYYYCTSHSNMIDEFTITVPEPAAEPEPEVQVPTINYNWINRGYEFGDKNWTSLAMSDNGRYQSSTMYQNKIHTSDDYGITWTPISQTLNQLWTCISMSSDGAIQFASTYYSNLYKSTDYGATWTKNSYIHQWTGIDMDSSGQYVTGVIINGYIKVSNDSGASWTSFGKNLGKKVWGAVKVSYTGKYQTALAVNDGIYRSVDYGITWDQKLDEKVTWKSVTMDSTGQYQMACAENGCVYNSDDYGNTWEKLEELGVRQWVSVSMSGDNYKRTILAKYDKIIISIDGGVIWKETGEDMFYKPWSTISMSFSGNFQSASVWGGSIYTLYIDPNDAPLPSSTEESGSTSMNGALIDGYIRDASGRLINITNNEIVTTFVTDSSGNWNIDISNSAIPEFYKIEFLPGGVDVTTNKVVNTSFSNISTKADTTTLSSFSLNITPITSIKAKMVEDAYSANSAININTSINDATSKVAIALDISADDIDKDFIKDEIGSVFKAANKISTITETLATAVRSQHGFVTNDNVMASLVSSLSSATAKLDFTSSSIIETIVSNSTTAPISNVVKTNASKISKTVSNNIDNETNESFGALVANVMRSSVAVTEYISDPNVNLDVSMDETVLTTQVENIKVTVVIDLSTVVDEVTPTITLEGAATIYVEKGAAYSELGATTDTGHNVTIGGTVDSAIVGTYTITYNATSDSNLQAVQVTRSVIVRDTVVPIITLNGLATVYVEKDGTYSELGATTNTGYSVTIGGNVDSAIIGTYTITYDATNDSNLQAVQVTRSVIVQDTVVPIITLTGLATVYVDKDGTYIELGATTDTGHSVTIGGTVDSALVGTYTITYDATNDSNLQAVQVTRSVIVQDTVVPIITLTGLATVYVDKDGTYSELGATTDTGHSVTIGGTVDSAVVGTYTITYDATNDSNLHAVQVTRSVIVRDTVLPVITLNGLATVYVDKDGTYTELGATTDTGHSVTIGGTVDSAIIGTYTITYDATNDSNLQAVQVTRTVVVKVSIVLTEGVNNLTWHSSGSDVIKLKNIDSTNISGNDYVKIDNGNTYQLNGSRWRLVAPSFSSSNANNVEIQGENLEITVGENSNWSEFIISNNDVKDYWSIIPVITLTGDATINLNKHGTYTELGATTDTGHSVTIGGIVDTSVPGTYTITYDATNDSNIQAVQVTRSVIVENTTLHGDPDGGILSSQSNINIVGKPIWGYPSLTVYAIGRVPETEAGGPVYENPISPTPSGQSQYVCIVDGRSGKPKFSYFNIVNNDYVHKYRGWFTNSISGVSNLSEFTQGIDNGTYSLADIFNFSFTGLNSNNGVYYVLSAIKTVSIPVITLTGNTSVTVEKDTTYSEPGYSASDSDSISLTSSVTVTNNINTSTTGTYYVYYNVSDSHGNAATEKVRTVIVEDSTLPIITLTGNASVTVEKDTSYNELGYSASDFDSIDLTSSVTVTNNINTSTTGTYYVYYNVSDAAGNAATQKVRTIIVEDTTLPVITLIGNTSVTVEKNESYSELGYSASDFDSIDLTSSVTVTNNINTSTIGTYYVYYNVSDADGNAATQKARTVFVEESNPPIITLNGLATVYVDKDGSYTELGATTDTGYSVTIGGDTVDSASPDTYTITYDATNDSNLQAVQVTRSVIVQPENQYIVNNGNYPGLTLTTVRSGVPTNAVVEIVSYTMNTVYSHAFTGYVFSKYQEQDNVYILGGYTSSGGTQYTLFNKVTFNVTSEGVLTIQHVGSKYKQGTIASENLTSSYNAPTGTISPTSNYQFADLIIRVIVQDTVIPVITLTGDATIYVEKDGTYSELGATTDTGHSVTIGGTVDSAIVGTYTITYDATNDSNLQAVQVTRSVIVQDTVVPDSVSFRKIKIMRVENQIYSTNQIYMIIGEVQVFVGGINVIPNLDNSKFTASSSLNGFDTWLVGDENINLGSPAPRFCWHSSISTDNSVVQSEWLLITLENNYNINNLQSAVVYVPNASDQANRNKMMNGCVIQILDENDSIIYATPTINNSSGTHQYFRLDGGDISNANMVNSGATSISGVINANIVENTNKWTVTYAPSSNTMTVDFSNIVGLSVAESQTYFDNNYSDINGIFNFENGANKDTHSYPVNTGGTKFWSHPNAATFQFTSHIEGTCTLTYGCAAGTATLVLINGSQQYSTTHVEAVETFSVQIGDVIVIKENVGVINLYSIVLAP